MIIKNHFHKKGFALGLVLKQRLAASRKWPIIRTAFCSPDSAFAIHVGSLLFRKKIVPVSQCSPSQPFFGMSRNNTPPKEGGASLRDIPKNGCEGDK